MTTFFNSSGPRIFIAAGLLLGMISTASAYTAEQQQLCTDDAFRLCSADIPDVDRVTACMARHKSELSAGCKSVFRPAPGTPAAATAPAPTPVSATKPRKRRRQSVTQ
jgi:hypothetical protein